jgi:hemerythrin-like domain-containing protein
MTTTIELLGTQHQEVLARLTQVEAAIMARDDRDLAPFAAFLADEVVHHFAIEEQALFPLLARHLSLEQGPLAVMNAEHAAFRELLADLTTAVRAGNLDAQRTHVAELVELLRGHTAKEDQVLFPMAARLLSPAELDEVDGRAAALAGSLLSSQA